MEDKIPVYELYIKDEDIEGLTAMGLVEIPAIQQDFIYFNHKHLGIGHKTPDTKLDVKGNVSLGNPTAKLHIPDSMNLSKFDDERRMIVGPALIVDKKIIKSDMFGELYYVTFTKDLVEKLAHTFLKESKQHLTTEQHETPIKNVYMIESWIVKNENDKIYTEYNYSVEDVTIGSWCVMYKVDNDKIIEKIKNGEIKGFSIEAFLSKKLIEQSELNKLYDFAKKPENKQKLVDFFKSLTKK